MTQQKLILTCFLLLCLVSTFFIAVSRTFAATGTSSPTDFNGDGKVDFNDVILFVDAYISFNHGQQYNHACDLNGDGKIDFTDVTLFINAYIAYTQTLSGH